MAMIIELSRVAEAVQDDSDTEEVRRPARAEVILFPGIRYERWSENASETVPQSASFGARMRSHVQRDWLDI